jgi:hypothetical protein
METPTVEIPASASAEADLEMGDDGYIDVDAPLDVAFGGREEDDANGEEMDQSHVFIE